MLLQTVSGEYLDSGLASPWLRSGKILPRSWETPKGLLGEQRGLDCGGGKGRVG